MNKAEALDRYIAKHVGYDLAEWPGGWPGEIEAALIDAVFSVRARYGAPNTGVRAVVKCWKNRSGKNSRVDDLAKLASADPAEFVRIVRNSSKISGRTKGEIVIDAARSLSGVGLFHAEQFTASDEQKAAYLAVKGCGPVTWSYFGMLLGKPDVKADTWIVRFVNAATGTHVTSREAGNLIKGIASDRGINATQLDHAIWNYARKNL